MSLAFASERRSLSEDEFKPIVGSHYPAVEELPREELMQLAKWLRGRRGRARDIMRCRRRIASGKAEPRGTAAETASERGLAIKKQIFASALKRVNARLAQIEAAERRALALSRLQAALGAKRDAVPHHPQTGRAANAGLRPKSNTKGRRMISAASIGSISQAVRNAQAARDARGA